VRGADLLQGECWFALEDDVEGNANLAPALLINRPRLGQVELRGEGQAASLATDRLTMTWQLSTLPTSPQYCRATPTECLPFLGMPLSSTIQKRSGPCACIAGRT
jgi:hypothetical protein